VTENASRDPLAESLRHASQILAAAGCEAPRLDSEVLLAHVLDRDRAWLYAHPEHVLVPTKSSAFRSLVSRRARREPVGYLTHHKEFYALDFFVTTDVLIPRPETEALVEQAIQWVMNSSWAGTIADVGTGSGAIAVTLAVLLPRAQVIASDASPAALAVARYNAARHGVANRVHPFQGDLLAPLRGPLDLIVANPPYLSQAELAGAPPEVAQWEPRAALDGGPDGLDVIRRLLDMASVRLRPHGALLVEIGAGQGPDVLGLARCYFPQATMEIARDYANRDRVLFVQHARRA
jgi:release factor glutamine methyltransferase